ncbi:hypothetical protein [Geoalkalibacter sp.]|uniref:hypothetical protein n=1 Tax=Geoalkalibacter sp. TaxID=3041440 RepID=UPI00272DF036|nr:hypothetical protein [Geoalkalibacter sp.]
MDTQDRETALNLIPGQKADLKRRIDAGECGLADDFERLMALEARLRAQIAAAQDDAGDPVMERLRVKRRPYTLSPAALEARRQNAQKSTGPTTEEGKARCSRNNWKHGLHAKKRMLGMGKPCRATCSHYPCQLVADGDTQPGGDCLDKEYYLHTLNAISRALNDGQMHELKDIVTMQLGGTIQVIDELQASILEYGVYLKSEKIDKEGKVIGYEIKPNPSLLPLSNLLKAAGVTLPDFMITPAAIERKKTDEEATATLADIFRGAGAALKQAKEKKD